MGGKAFLLTAKHLSEWKHLDTNIHVWNWNYITPTNSMLTRAEITRDQREDLEREAA